MTFSCTAVPGPWYVVEQYLQDNDRPLRRIGTAAGQASRDQPQAVADDDADEEQLHDEDEGIDITETEESESEEEKASEATKILRQLRGAQKVEEVDRSSEMSKKTTMASKHNYYRDTKVTSRAQEEQSAVPGGVLNVYEDSTDEEDYCGEQKEIEFEMQALRGSQQWVNQPGWDVASEGIAVDANGAEVNLSAPTSIDGKVMSWEDVQRELAKGAVCEDDSVSGHVMREDVLRDYALDKLDPTQRVFVDRVLHWGSEVVDAYKRNIVARKKGKKLQRVPTLRAYLCGSAGSGKSTTLRTTLVHLRWLFQEQKINAAVELTAYTGVAAFNIGFGAKTACSAFQLYPKHKGFKRELQSDKYRTLEKQWENVELLIVDEISFIGRAFFFRMHVRMQQAKRDSLARKEVDPQECLFGDISMILVGDFGQLDPISDISFCDDEMTYSTCPKPLHGLWGHAQSGRRLLECFTEATVLRRIHRSQEDQWWTQSCLRLRDFEMTYHEDYETLARRG